GDWGPANNGINYNGFVPSLAATNTHLFAYTSSRLFVSDDGEDWDTLAHASDYTSMQVLASQGNVILKDAYTIYYSTDNGGTWIDNSDQFPSEDDGFAFRTTISSGDYIIASAYMDGTLFYYSADGGVTWESFTFPGTYVATMSYSENTLFVSSDSIYSTSDFGDNWSIISRPGIENISNIGPFSKAGNRIIAHITTYTTKEVYYTEDNGATWIQAIDGLPDDYLINSMNFYNNILMATGDKGVFYSTDSAETWIELNDGFERRVNVYQPVIMDGYLYAGTFRDGVWKRSTDNILSVEVNGSVIPVDYNLKQNYPNPFNPTTTIEFSIPERSVIKLMIYNSIGQEIESIINEEIPAGNYKFNWDASQYSSGVYFYKLVSNNYSITKKALLLK
ncbi:MAG: T9SS type A sorting domain-containing protein, partial [Melioribacteraceae bacterium]|nr:T9SS type A sorting domain-containing protein [Melioribacteraceae bacterium]